MSTQPTEAYTGVDNLEVMQEAVNYNRYLLDTVTLSRREMKRLHYLGLQGPTFRERRRSSSGG